MPFESTGDRVTGEWATWLSLEELEELCLLEIEISMGESARAQRQRLRKRASKRMEKARTEAKEEANAKGSES